LKTPIILRQYNDVHFTEAAEIIVQLPVIIINSLKNENEEARLIFDDAIVEKEY
jgi:hypothetical protein